MTSGEARTLLEVFVPSYEDERAITHRVLTAIPDSGAQYQPDAKARTAIQLAYHLAHSETWFLHSIAGGSFLFDGEERMPDELSKPSAIAAWYLKATEEGLEKVKRISSEHAAKTVDFFVTSMPNVMCLQAMLNHTIHHRGQLAAYLRPAGGKVPDIYGGSADEPWKG